MSTSNLPATFYTKELSVCIAYSLCTVYISMNAIFTYFLYGKYFLINGVTSELDNIFNYMIVFFVSLNIVSILFNARMNWRYRNFRMKSSTENPIVLYLMSMPLVIFSLVAMLYFFIYTVFNVTIKGVPSLISLLSMLLVFIAIVQLVIDTNGIKDTGECWMLNLSNFVSISLSIISLVSISATNYVLLHYFSFKSVLNYYSNTTKIPHSSNQSTSQLIHQTFKEIIIYYHSSLILLSLTTVPNFILPLKQSLHFLQIVPPTSSQVSILEKRDIFTHFDTIFNTLLIAILAMVRIAFMALPTNETRMALKIVECAECSVIGALAIFILSDRQFWMRNKFEDQKTLFNRIMLWMGMLGEVTLSLVPIAGILARIYVNSSTMYDNVHILNHLLKFVQIIPQTIFMAMILERNFKASEKEPPIKVLKCLNPILIVIVINTIILIWDLIPHSLNYPDTKSGVGSLLVKGSNALFFPLIVLYRVYCILILVKMLIDMK